MTILINETFSLLQYVKEFLFKKIKKLILCNTIQFKLSFWGFFFHKLLPAMSSRDDPLVVDQRAATVMVADVDGNLPWLRVGCTFIATHNLVICRGWSYESNMNKKKKQTTQIVDKSTRNESWQVTRLNIWIFFLIFSISTSTWECMQICFTCSA